MPCKTPSLRRCLGTILHIASLLQCAWYLRNNPSCGVYDPQGGCLSLIYKGLSDVNSIPYCERVMSLSRVGKMFVCREVEKCFYMGGFAQKKLSFMIILTYFFPKRYKGTAISAEGEIGL